MLGSEDQPGPRLTCWVGQHDLSPRVEGLHARFQWHATERFNVFALWKPLHECRYGRELKRLHVRLPANDRANILRSSAEAQQQSTEHACADSRTA